jgi:hypothetical protein
VPCDVVRYSLAKGCGWWRRAATREPPSASCPPRRRHRSGSTFPVALRVQHLRRARGPGPGSVSPPGAELPERPASRRPRGRGSRPPGGRATPVLPAGRARRVRLLPGRPLRRTPDGRGVLDARGRFGGWSGRSLGAAAHPSLREPASMGDRRSAPAPPRATTACGVSSRPFEKTHGRSRHLRDLAEREETRDRLTEPGAAEAKKSKSRPTRT